MPTPTPYAIGAEWQTNGSADFLHLKDKGGTIIGWIDKDGFLQGTLASGGGSLELEINGTPNVDQSLLNLIAGSNITLSDDGLGGITIASSGGGGNGFQNGTTVANSTGNTPANGFTLDSGVGDTNAVAPNNLTMSTSNNGGGVIELDNSNNAGVGSVSVGNATTLGASTLSSSLTPGILTLNNNMSGASLDLDVTGSVPLITANDGLGNTADFGFPAAGFTLVGAGGTSITEDGTVPSTIWNDGAGGQIIAEVTSGEPDIYLVDVTGNSIVFATSSTGAIFRGQSANGGEVAWTINDGAASTLMLNDSLGGATQISSAVQTTVGGIGGASPLPATPLGYILGLVGVTVVAIPYYLAS